MTVIWTPWTRSISIFCNRILRNSRTTGRTSTRSPSTTAAIADLTPAYQIFDRFLERLKQRVAYEDKLLKHDRFALNTHQSILLDRRDAPYPKNLAEARQLWQQRLIYDYLQEVLSRRISPTNSGVILPLPKSAPREITDKLARHYHWQLHMFTNWDGSDVLADLSERAHPRL